MHARDREKPNDPGAAHCAEGALLGHEPTERQLRRLFRRAARTPLPEPELSDEQLAEYVREHATDPTDKQVDSAPNHPRPRPNTPHGPDHG